MTEKLKGEAEPNSCTTPAGKLRSYNQPVTAEASFFFHTVQNEKLHINSLETQLAEANLEVAKDLGSSSSSNNR